MHEAITDSLKLLWRSI